MSISIRRKIGALALVLVLFAVTSFAEWSSISAKENAATVVKEAAKPNKITSKKLMTYMLSDDPKQAEKVKVYYLNGSDIPYLEISDFIGIKKKISLMMNCDDFQVKITKKGNNVKLTRDDGNWAKLDFKKDTITFWDYNTFFRTGDNEIMDLVPSNYTDDYGLDYFITRVKNKNNTRMGNGLEFDMKDYNIDLVREGKKYLVPLQTLSDIFLVPSLANLLYNGECLIVFNPGLTPLVDAAGEFTALGELYYGVGNGGKVSAEMAEYNYNELCFAFDNFYGLKENHKIESFDELVSNNCLDSYFLSTDPVTIDKALYEVIKNFIDDLHSSYLFSSYATGLLTGEQMSEILGQGISSEKYSALLVKYYFARAEFFPNGVPFYQEIDDTAYITIDDFDSTFTNYYATGFDEETATDTFRIIGYSVQQILRKNSPIKNVVLDLSCNYGGSTEAAVYTLGALLGDATICLEDPNTGAFVTNMYMSDTNLDHEFDEKDTLAGKGLNLYCLVSGVSFSSANLVASILKYSNEVTILGQTSGGGACTVLPLVTALGSVISISSSERMSYLRNGAYYDLEQGVTPDFTISKLEHFYDRKALTKYIQGLF